MIARRVALGAILTLTLLGVQLPAEGQQPAHVPRIGVLTGGAGGAALDAFRQGLRDLGYTEGQSIAVEYRSAEEKWERLPDLAAALVRLKVDVIFALYTPAALAAKQATSTIPVVAGAMADPVGDALVTSLARPGGNITGTAFLGPQLVAKRLELLKEALPSVLRVAALWNPGAYGERTTRDMLNDTELAARALGVRLQLLETRGPNDLDSAFAAMTRERAGALIVLPSPRVNLRRIVDLAAKHRLPAMYQSRGPVDAGGLMAYGANLADLCRQAAVYVDKILKGAKPADLPVAQPTKFELVINMKTAKTLGLTISQSLLLRADYVIE
jgi:putative ABC transport system substrate-binding protein